MSVAPSATVIRLAEPVRLMLARGTYFEPNGLAVVRLRILISEQWERPFEAMRMPSALTSLGLNQAPCCVRQPFTITLARQRRGVTCVTLHAAKIDALGNGGQAKQR
ncbi:MAG: hypothetical protein ACI8PT_000964 [Gammaproteobacteria bacterium]|jgi:hypothetical protein